MATLEDLARALLRVTNDIDPLHAADASPAQWRSHVNHPLVNKHTTVIDIDTLAAELGLACQQELQGTGGEALAADMGAALYGSALEYAARYAEVTPLSAGLPLIYAREALAQRQLHTLLGEPVPAGYDTAVQAAFWDDLTGAVIAGQVGFNFDSNGRSYTPGHHRLHPTNPVIAIWRRGIVSGETFLLMSTSGPGSCGCEDHRDQVRLTSNVLNPGVCALYMAEVARRVLLGRPTHDPLP